MPLVHKHLIIRAEVTTPPTDEQLTVEWMKKLISTIGMKVLMGPYAKYLDVVGNRGLTRSIRPTTCCQRSPRI